MAEIVGKNLAGIYPRALAKLLHCSPNIRAVYRAPAFGNKNRAGADVISLAIPAQRAPEFFGQQDNALLALAVNICLSAA